MNEGEKKKGVVLAVVVAMVGALALVGYVLWVMSSKPWNSVGAQINGEPRKPVVMTIGVADGDELWRVVEAEFAPVPCETSGAVKPASRLSFEPGGATRDRGDCVTGKQWEQAQDFLAVVDCRVVGMWVTQRPGLVQFRCGATKNLPAWREASHD